MAAFFVPRSVRRKEPQTNRPGCIKHKKINSSNVLPSKVEIRDERAPMHSNLQGEILNSSLKLAKNTVAIGSECCEESDGDEEVVSYSKNQRWPTSGEPVCVMCGRYGAYIVDQTDQDVCSLECKAKHLKDVAKKSKEGETYSNRDTISSDLNFVDESCSQGSIMAKALITTTTKGYLQCTSSSQIECLSQSEKFVFHYTEHPAVAGLSSSKIESIRMNLNIQVKGERVERPILEFEHCPFSKTLSSNLKNCGYITPTPAQMQVIPVGLSVRDVLACAQTGSGKTAAFLLPMIHRIYLETDYVTKSRRSPHLQHPLGIIMAPTRELCIQIEKQAKELMLGLSNMKTALLVGGLPLPPQLHRLRTGVQIIVATPGRMLEVLAQSAVDLSFVRISVLDEVDTMLQMGFEHQVREVLENLPREKQTMMFSATIPPSIESMATKLLVNPVYISVGSPSLPNTAVKQIVLWVEDKSKKRRLFSILQDSRHFKPPIVVFVDSKMGADLLAEAIQKVCNLSCLSMHGDKSQSERTSTLESFLAGDCPVIVCTALLGRGIDLPNVSQVINFDMPSSIEEYVHQVGRAGRLGKSGAALTFVNNTNKSVFLSLVETLQPLGVSLPQELLNSPYLHQQVQRAKDSGRKRKRRDQLVTEENLIDLLKRSTVRRKK